MSTYHFDEMSVQSAQPVLLVDFTDGTTHWRYTTCAYTLVHGDETYTHQPGLTTGDYEVSKNALRAAYEIIVPWSCPFVQQYIADPPDDEISVTVYRMHTTEDADYQLFGRGTFGSGIFGGHARIRYWGGYVRSVGFTGQGRQAKITCVASLSELGVAGLCLRYGRACTVPLYSLRCGVTKADYAAAGTVLTVSGYTVTAAVFGLQADGYYRGGTLETSTRKRTIISHVGTEVELTSAISSLEAGDAFECYPGCDHVHMGHCDTRFGNKLSFQGQPYIPTNNPVVEGI